MRVMVMVKATADSEVGAPPAPGMFVAMEAFNAELEAAGVMVTADGLTPSARGVRVRFDGDTRTVTPGPFAPAESLVAGFWIWEVASLDDAIAWVRKCPNPMPGCSDVEVRPFISPEEFREMLAAGEKDV